MKAIRPVEASALMQMYLRIKHPALHPNEITETLQLQPEEIRTAGASTTRGGIRQVHCESYWIAALPFSTLPDLLESIQAQQKPATSRDTKAASLWLHYLKHQAGELESLLALSLAGLFNRLDAQKMFLQRVNQEGGSVTLLIQRTNYGEPLSLAASVLTKLAELGVGIEVN